MFLDPRFRGGERIERCDAGQIYKEDQERLK